MIKGLKDYGISACGEEEIEFKLSLRCCVLCIVYCVLCCLSYLVITNIFYYVLFREKGKVKSEK